MVPVYSISENAIAGQFLFSFSSMASGEKDDFFAGLAVAQQIGTSAEGDHPFAKLLG